MTSPDGVRCWPELETVASPLSPLDRVLVVSAHPDDETIGAGRLVADHPGPVAALTLSLGESCLPGHDQAAMGERRLAEWERAVAALGMSVELGVGHWPDGELHAFEAEMAADLADVFASYDSVLVTWRHDPHPDHRAAATACLMAADDLALPVVEFPVWAPLWTTVEDVARTGFDMYVVATTQHADEARAAALAAYTSQTGPGENGEQPVVPATLLERHREQLVAVPR